MHPNHPDPDAAATAAIAALAGLLLLDLAMFASMLAGVAPHPAGDRGPFIAATAALALADLLLVAGHRRTAGGWVALVTALACLPGVGPHKFWTEPAARDLAPVIIVGTTGLLVLAWSGLAMVRGASTARSATPLGPTLPR